MVRVCTNPMFRLLNHRVLEGMGMQTKHRSSVRHLYRLMQLGLMLIVGIIFATGCAQSQVVAPQAVSPTAISIVPTATLPAPANTAIPVVEATKQKQPRGY